jgi:glycosyltransferase involved in cell wall biosynthesis
MHTNKKISCTLIVPLFNNEKNIFLFYKSVVNFINSTPSVDFHLMFVDDGSKDLTLLELKKQNIVITTCLVQLDKNYGQTTALTVGMALASTDLILVKSSDMQESFDVLSEVLENYEPQQENILFLRAQRRDKVMKRFYSNLFYSSIRIFNKKIPEGGFDTVLLTKKTYGFLAKNFYMNRFLQLDILNSPGGKTFFYFTRKEDNNRVSSWTFLKNLKYAFDAFLLTLNIKKPIYVDINSIISKAKIEKIKV